jgi:hypothetical protein
LQEIFDRFVRSGRVRGTMPSALVLVTLLACACGSSLPSQAPGVGKPAVLAAQAGVVGGMAVHDGFVWWTSHDFTNEQAGRLSRVPIAGGPVERVATFAGSAGPVIAADRIYFGAGNVVMVMDGAAAVALTPPQLLEIEDIAVRGDTIYFTYGGSSIEQVAKNMGRPTTVFTVGGRVLEIEIDGGTTYYAYDNLITSRGGVMPLESGRSQLDDFPHTPMGLSVSPSGVFWAQDGKLRGIRRDGTKLGPVPIDDVRLLAAGSRHLFWTEHYRLVRRPISGGKLERVGPEAKRLVVVGRDAYGFFEDAGSSEWFIGRISNVE